MHILTWIQGCRRTSSILNLSSGLVFSNPRIRSLATCTWYRDTCTCTVHIGVNKGRQLYFSIQRFEGSKVLDIVYTCMMLAQQWEVHVHVHVHVYQYVYTLYMEIHVYSIIARLVIKEEKKENPDPIHHTKTIQTRNTQ